MKKFLMGVFSALLVLVATAAVAQQNQPANPPKPDQVKGSNVNAGTFEGTVTQIDQSGRTFVVRETGGTDVTITWDQATRLTGSETTQGTATDRSGQASSNMSGLKVGDEVVVKTTDQDGKKVAASVQIRTKKS
jgi:YD repeat-containing protein